MSLQPAESCTDALGIKANQLDRVVVAEYALDMPGAKTYLCTVLSETTQQSPELCEFSGSKSVTCQPCGVYFSRWLHSLGVTLCTIWPIRHYFSSS